MKLQVVLLLAAAVLLGKSGAAVLSQDTLPLLANDVAPKADLQGVPTDVGASTADDDSNDEDWSVFPDVDLAELRDDELEDYADAKDLEMEGELDLLVAAKVVQERREVTRPKRWIPLAARALLTAGRALFRSSARGALSRSGSRLTRQYQSRGNYRDAVNHFRNFKPENVRNFRTDRLEGMTGTVGRHRMTVRSSSSSGRPTLEIRSPSGRQGADTFVRKFRFNN